MKENTQHNLSVKRVLGDREHLLKELKKKHAKLNKQIAKQKEKLASFKNQVSEDIRASEMKLGKARGESRENFQRFVGKVIAACESKRFTNADKIVLRDLLLQAVHLIGSPDLDLPPWLFLNPPDPKTPPTTNKSKKDEELFDFEDLKEEFWEEFLSGADGEPNDPSNTKVNETFVQELRRVYLRIAAQIHPDKGVSEEDRAYRTRFMQDANHAYKSGDVLGLLRLERQWKSRVPEESLLNSPFHSAIEQQLQCLEQEVALLEAQLKNLKVDLKQEQRSEEAQILKTRKKMAKDGLDPDESMIRSLLSLGKLMGEFANDISKVLTGKSKRGPTMQKIKAITAVDEYYQQELEDELMEMFESIFDQMEFNTPRKRKKR